MQYPICDIHPHPGLPRAAGRAVPTIPLHPPEPVPGTGLREFAPAV